MNAKEILSIMPNLNQSSAYRLITVTPPIQPFEVARSLGFPRPGGNNGQRYSFAIKNIQKASSIISGMKAFSIEGEFTSVYDSYVADCLRQSQPNVKFPFSEARFLELLRINHINLRAMTKFHSKQKIRLKSVLLKLKRLESKDRLSVEEKKEMKRLDEEKVQLQAFKELAGLLRADHQNKRLLSNMVNNKKRSHVTIDHFAIGLGRYGLEATVEGHVIILYFPFEPKIPPKFDARRYQPPETKLEPFDDTELEKQEKIIVHRNKKAEMTGHRALGLKAPMREPNVLDKNRRLSNSPSPELLVDPKIKLAVETKEKDRAYIIRICILAQKRRLTDENEDGENPEDDDEHFEGQTPLASCRDLAQVVATEIFSFNNIDEMEIDSDGDPRNYVTGISHYYLSSLKKPNGPFTFIARNIFAPGEGASYADQLIGNVYRRLDANAAVGHHVTNIIELARVVSEVAGFYVFLASKEIEAEVEEKLPAVVKSPVPFLKANYQFVVNFIGSYKARRSPNDEYLNYELVGGGIDLAPTAVEAATAEWFHRSKTLQEQRKPKSSKSDRSSLKRKETDKDIAQVSEESEEIIKERPKGKKGRRNEDSAFRPFAKRRREEENED
jgi:hypothetical protein